MIKLDTTLRLRPNGPMALGPRDINVILPVALLPFLVFVVIFTLNTLSANNDLAWVARGVFWGAGAAMIVLMILEFLVGPTVEVNEEGVWLRQGRLPSKSLPWGRVEKVMYGTNIQVGVRLLPRPRTRDSGYFINFVDRKRSRSFGVGELSEGVPRAELEAWVATALKYAGARGIPVVKVPDRDDTR